MTRQQNQSLGCLSSRKTRRSRKQSRTLRILCETSLATRDLSVWTVPKAAHRASRRSGRLQQVLHHKTKVFYNQISRVSVEPGSSPGVAVLKDDPSRTGRAAFHRRVVY